MTSRALTVEDYLAELPADRQAVLRSVRSVLLANLAEGFEEGMQYGMIGYYVPHLRYPKGYHCDPKQPLPFIGLGTQKHHYSLYMFCLYVDTASHDQFVTAYQASGKRMDLGNGCVRFKSLDELPLELVGKTIADISVDGFISEYERHIPDSKRKASSSKRG